MKRFATLEQCRRPALRAWVGAALVACLLLADAFALTHRLDAAAHSDGQACTVCLSTTVFGASAVSDPSPLALPATAPVFAATLVAVLVSIAPFRRYARGPPAVSFTS